MKSLRYILGGRPHTLDDCLDLALSRSPEKVILDLAVNEFVGDLRILHQFVGIYRWEFADHDILCTDIYGCVFLPATVQQQLSSVATANTMLKRRLEKFHRQGIEVVGSSRRFEDLENFYKRK